MADSGVAALSDDQIERLLQEAETRLSGGKGDIVAAEKNGELSQASKAGQAKTVSAPTTTTPGSNSGSSTQLSLRDPQPRKSKVEMAAKPDAGASWYNIPKTDLTPELKRDLQLLKMRDVLDPKRFYRKDNTKAAVPTYSQVGTLIESPTEWFSGRLTKKERKRTLLEEVLETEGENRRFKRKYGEIQTSKMSGRKGHYKKMMEKRYGRKG